MTKLWESGRVARRGTVTSRKGQTIVTAAHQQGRVWRSPPPPYKGGLGPAGPTHPEPQIRKSEPRPTVRDANKVRPPEGSYPTPSDATIIDTAVFSERAQLPSMCMFSHPKVLRRTAWKVVDLGALPGD